MDQAERDRLGEPEPVSRRRNNLQIATAFAMVYHRVPVRVAGGRALASGPTSNPAHFLAFSLSAGETSSEAYTLCTDPSIVEAR